MYRELFERACSRDDATTVLAPAEGVSRGRGHGGGWKASRSGGESVGLVGERLSVGCQRASQSLRAAQAPTTHLPSPPLTLFVLQTPSHRPSHSSPFALSASASRFSFESSSRSPSRSPLFVLLSRLLSGSFIPIVSLSSEFTPLLRATSTLQCCAPPPILHI